MKEKIEKDYNSVAEVATHFENWWMEMESIFAKLGWI